VSCPSGWPAFLVGIAAGLAVALIVLVVLDRLVMARLSAGELYQAARPRPCGCGEREVCDECQGPAGADR
jgi:hypothetical protein